MSRWILLLYVATLCSLAVTGKLIFHAFGG
jgi:hypothetical protein